MSKNGVVLDAILSTLNKQQRLAVEFDPSAALQVIAGPGTGKTRVLTARVAYLLLKCGFRPRDIIVTTFTNKAAREMIERLGVLLEGTDVKVEDLFIGTFHSICLKILARFGSKIGLEPGWRIVEEREINSIIDDLIEKMPDPIRDYALSFNRVVNLCRPKNGGDTWVVHPKQVKNEISKLKSQAVLPEEYEQEPEHDVAVVYFYYRYQAALRALNALDFDDLLMFTFRLLCKERCLPYVQHVFVDEFQDTSGLQIDLMFLFARGRHHLSRGITVVGDPDQSIYAFRNAHSQNFASMAAKCPIPCSQVVLIENYRSSQRILDTSETLMKQQVKDRHQRLPLRAQFDCDFPPVYINFPVGFLQGVSLAKELLYLKSLPDLFSYDDFAILVRQRRQIKSIEQALIVHRIPYRIIRGRAFWELKEITAMLDLLRCVYSENDINAIIDCLLYPNKGFGQISAERLREVVNIRRDKNPDITAFSIVEHVAEQRIPINITPKARLIVKDFVSMIRSVREIAGPMEPFTSSQAFMTSLSEIFDKLYSLSGLEYEYLYKESNNSSQGKNIKKKVKEKDRERGEGVGEEEEEGEKGNDDEEGSAGKRIKNSAAGATGSKKNGILGKEPDYSNPRHKNIEILKEYFLDTKKLDNIPQTQTQPQPSLLSPTEGGRTCDLHEHLRIFFNSLSLYTSDTPQSDADAFESQNPNETAKQGTVTISTIHGAKGLEWPVVFVPGCVEGIIPSIFPSGHKDEVSEDDDDDEDDKGKGSEDDMKTALEAGTNSKDEKGKSSKNPARLLDEERRMFFVAQTRAKVLLYLSSVKEDNNPIYGGPSRFLTKEVLDTVCDKQMALDSVENITTLYEVMNKSIPDGSEKLFSFKRLVSDYREFVQNRRESMVWNGRPIRNLLMLDITRNRVPSPTSNLGITADFSTAAEQLRISTQGKGLPMERIGTPVSVGRKQRQFQSQAVKTTLQETSRIRSQPQLSLEKSYAPKSNIKVSPVVKRTYAPKMDNVRISPIKRINISSIQNKASSNNIPDNANFQTETKTGNLSPRMYPTLKRTITTTPINLDPSPPPKELAKTKRNLKLELEETTAAEVLFDANDLAVDNRPIITNAKTLAKAIKKRSERSGENGGKDQQTPTDPSVKREAPATERQIDIFSELARAKKKAKLNKSEIIVIDD